MARQEKEEKQSAATKVKEVVDQPHPFGKGVRPNSSHYSLQCSESEP